MDADDLIVQIDAMEEEAVSDDREVIEQDVADITAILALEHDVLLSIPVQVGSADDLVVYIDAWEMALQVIEEGAVVASPAEREIIQALRP